MRNNKIIVILGPTSSGKSEIAIRLAKKLALSKIEGSKDAEIISADSRQIYRGMDIGTGKIVRDFSVPSSKLKAQSSKLNIYWSDGIPHYMIDIINPNTDYNVAKFKKQAEKIIEDILKRGKLPIICGGTGFWIKAIVDNVDFPAVKSNKVLRNQLSNKSAEALFKMLRKLDPKRAETIDKKNKVRLVRAIEIAKSLDHVPNIKYQILNTKYHFLQIGIDVPKEKLRKNIQKRLETRFKQGMIKEVKKLREKYKLSWKKIQSFGLGYLWIPLYLQGKLTKQEVFEKVYPMEYPAERDNFAKRNLFHRVYLAEKDYAKRQMTWFRKDRRIKWLKSYKEIERETRKFLTGK